MVSLNASIDIDDMHVRVSRYEAVAYTAIKAALQIDYRRTQDMVKAKLQALSKRSVDKKK